MTVIGEAFIDVRPRTDGFEKETTGKIVGIAKKAASAFAGAFVIKQGFDFAKGLTEDAEEARKVAAQTNAVIASTGGIAKVTAADVDRLSASLSRKVAIDDEAIAEGANLLLTFTNIRNEVGKGNRIFDRATGILADMGKALGTDVKGSAIQVGKALNDPIAGISALTRVGVTFTDQQKDQIKAMVEAGNVAAAQRVILDELAKEFGGSAAAQATAGDRLRVVYGNIREELGARLLPLVDRVATVVADRLPDALATVGRVGRTVLDTLRPVFGAIRSFVTGPAAAVADTIRDVFRTLTSGVGDIGAGLVVDLAGLFNISEDDPRLETFFAIVERIEDVVGGVIRVVSTVARRVVDVLGDAFGWLSRNKDVVGVFAGVILSVVAAVKVWTTVTKVFTAVQAALNVVMAANPVGAIVVAIAAIVAGVYLAYRRFEGFRNVVDTVFRALRTGFDAVVGFVREIMPAVTEALGHVVAVGRSVFEGVLTVVRTVLAAIKGAWSLFGDDLLRIVGAVWAQVQNIVETVIKIVSNVVRLVLAVINGDWSEAWRAVQNIVKAAVEYVVDTIRNFGGILSGALGAVWSGLKAGASAAWAGFKDLAGAAISGLVDLVLGLPGRLLSLHGALLDAAVSLGKAILQGIGRGIGEAVEFVTDLGKSITNALIGFINDKIIGPINDALSFRIEVLGKGITIDAPDIPKIPKLASGGIALPVPGGQVVNIAERGQREAILPLPPGVLEGLKAIAAGGAGPLVGQLVVPASPGSTPYATGIEVVRQLRAEQYRRTGR